MGQAKAKRAQAAGMVYHHTSSLRTNLLWMSGQILPEGQGEPAFHPQLGEVKNNALIRRAMRDFPALVWFTTRLDVPNCLKQHEIVLQGKDGAETRIPIAEGVSNALALNRLALGFRSTDIGVVPWRDYPGYLTAEGAELNETARDVGDNPDDWYVCEQPVDLMLMSEIRISKRVQRPKLERADWYLADVKRMVIQCRTTPGAFIPPSWLTPEQAQQLSARLGVPILK